MLLKSQKDVTYMVIANVVPTVAHTTHVSALATGQWAIINQDGYCRGTSSFGSAGTTASIADDILRVAQNNNGVLMTSPVISPAAFIAVGTRKNSAAVTEQISYIGYVGSGTENISAVDNNDYMVRIIMKGVSAQYGDKMMYKFGAYRSSNSATSMEIALGLAVNLTVNFKRERILNGEQLVKFEVLTGTASTYSAMDNAS